MWQKIQLFVISLWLLFFLILVYTIKIPLCFGDSCQFIGFWAAIKLNIIPIICFLLMLLGLWFYKLFNYRIIKGAPYLPQKVTDIKDINYETVSFLISYIIPLLFFVVGADQSAYRNFTVLIITLIIIGIIYCKTNMFYTNPTLAILNYHVYKITTNKPSNIIVIIHGKLNIGDIIFPRPIDDNIYFITKEKQ